METPKIIRPTLSSYTTLAFSALLLFLYCLYYSLPLFHTSLAAALFLYSIAQTRLDYVSITIDGISRHYNLWQRRALSWSDISTVSTSSRKVNKKNRYTIITISSNNPSKQDVKINMRILSKESVQDIAKTLIEKTSATKCDEATKQLADGIMFS
jgi:hypothetical protein